ncbi:hypothetical protein DPX16_17488 [Anabarilius grahami]|uniref:Uncharacterized protein n=1 Tax=Anabarilius grahami TaxID=495550 RepID=A0A3N0XZ88_ANAGA|nr:hypothetical protein DPX16_17488 [Anabarilius grahami]
MDLPAVQLLCVELEHQSLEDHTRKSSMPNKLSRLFVPEPSYPPPTHYTELKPEPTTEEEPKLATMPVPVIKTEPTIAPEPKPKGKSDQVCVPTIMCIAVGLLMELEGMEKSPAHTPVAGSELQLASTYCFMKEEEDIFLTLLSPVGPAQHQVSCVSTGSSQLEVSCVSRDPAQLPSPTSSSKANQSVGLTSIGSCQLLSSSIVYSNMLRGCALDLLITCSTLERGFPGSTSSHRAYHYILACRPVGSALAPPSLVLMAPQGSLVPLALPWSSVTPALPQYASTLSPPWLLSPWTPPWTIVISHGFLHFACSASSSRAPPSLLSCAICIM